MPDTTFTPNRLLQNPHVQSIVSSTLPRKLLVERRAREVLQSSQDMLLDCGNGVRLLGHYTPAQRSLSRGLVTLLHGWEGCSESNYLLSLASRLYSAGYAVFRLNLRDHGPTHHLNRELFNSTLLDEVLGAMEAIQARLPHKRQFLAGFSLGGNFALRVGADAAGRRFEFTRIVAVCPVVSPPHTMDTLHNGPRLYHDYFVRKWKRSLLKKAQLFPEYPFREQLGSLSTLREMNQYFVPRHTEFADPQSYLQAYAISGDRLATLKIPAHIITSADDPVVAAEDFALINRPPALNIEITQFGGHCGYIQNLKLDSWIDQRIIELLTRE
jgi:hypothetical protein